MQDSSVEQQKKETPTKENPKQEKQEKEIQVKEECPQVKEDPMIKKEDTEKINVKEEIDKQEIKLDSIPSTPIKEENPEIKKEEDKLDALAKFSNNLPGKKSGSSTPSSKHLFFPKRKTFNTSGQKMNLIANYFHFYFTNPAVKSFWKYAINFEPDIPEDSKDIRKKIFRIGLKEVESVYGMLTYNNTSLYCTRFIEGTRDFKNLKFNETDYTLIIKFACEVLPNSIEALPIYKRIVNTLIGKNDFIYFKGALFNKNALKRIQDKYEIWPGFEYSLNLLSDRLLLNLNYLSKIIRYETGKDQIDKIRNSYGSNYKLKIPEMLKGKSILTRYNNDKTFTIIDIDFTLSPKDKFPYKHGPISYIEYYKEKYGKVIRDVNQPLFLCIEKKNANPVHIIPELCLMTGLTDEMRSNFNLMKEITTETIGEANGKMNECVNLVKTIINNSKCKEITQKWGVSIDLHPMKLNGTKLNPDNLIIKNEKIPIENNRELDRRIQNEMYYCPSLDHWAIFYDENIENDFRRQVYSNLRQAIQQFKLHFNEPHLVKLRRGARWNEWQRTVEDSISRYRSQGINIKFILCILPGPKGRGIGYEDLKILMNNRYGIPSQVLLEGTVKRPKGIRSVVNKMLIQICAKLGGEPWIIDNLPLNSQPITLISFCKYKNIISSVGTYNINCTKYTSNSDTIINDDELNDKIISLFEKQLQDFMRKNHGRPPVNVIIFKDGIVPSIKRGELENEITILKSSLKKVNPNAKMSFIMVNKKHNLKAVLDLGNRYANIPSGTLIDRDVVSDEFEFYLISQSSSQGISQGTQYKVVYDAIDLKPNDIQNLIYKTCHLYYNWTGAIRNPAPVHYAKKLATLIGDKMTKGKDSALPCKEIGGLYFI